MTTLCASACEMCVCVMQLHVAPWPCVPHYHTRIRQTERNGSTKTQMNTRECATNCRLYVLRCCARVARPCRSTWTWRHARRGHQLTEISIPALLGLHFNGLHLLFQFFRLCKLWRLLPTVVGASRHPVWYHVLHLAHGPSPGREHRTFQEISQQAFGDEN